MSELSPSLSRSELVVRAIAVAAAVGLTMLTGCANAETPPDNPTPTATSPSNSPSLSPSPSRTPSVEKPTQSSEDAAIIESRLTSNNPTAKGVGALEKTAKRKLFGSAMEFFRVGAGKDELASVHEWQTAAISELTAAKLPNPYVILEPATVKKSELDTYFSTLKEEGADELPFRTVAMPEYIAGRWSVNPNNDATHYVSSVNATLRSAKDNLPNTQGSILVDTDSEEMPQILAAITSGKEKLDTSLIDSVGIQAFANAAPIKFDSNGKADISPYLSVKHIQDLVDATGIDKVWINTGIHKQDAHLGPDQDNPLVYSSEQRVAIAKAVADVVQEAQQAGITVEGLMLFAENKMKPPKEDPDAEAEGRDFSFNKSDIKALTTLADRLKELNVPLSGFATVE